MAKLLALFALVSGAAAVQRSSVKQAVLAELKAPGVNSCRNCLDAARYTWFPGSSKDVQTQAYAEFVALLKKEDYTAAVVPSGHFCTKNVETIGTKNDGCCDTGALNLKLGPKGEETHDTCYAKLCAMGGSSTQSPCNTYCYDESGSPKTGMPCFDLICRGGGRCDQKGAYSAIDAIQSGSLEGGSDAKGAIVDLNPWCASIMMTDDGSECGYQVGCSTINLGAESPCGYWCGRVMSKSACNYDASKAPATTAFDAHPDARNSHWGPTNAKYKDPVELGGCQWDDSKVGVCRKTEVPLRNNISAVTITGCEGEVAVTDPVTKITSFQGKPCEYKYNTVTGAITEGGPCKPCNLGFCQAKAGARDLGSAGAKCRAWISGAPKDVKDVRYFIGSAKELGFPNDKLPAACDNTAQSRKNLIGYGKEHEFMQYTTQIQDFTSRQERCKNTERTGTGCTWINQGDAKGCMSNMCGYLNTPNGCTIEQTQGRCVWYEKDSSFGLGTGAGSVVKTVNPMRPGKKGCFNSPCATPSPNKKWKCAKNGNNPQLAGCMKTCADGYWEARGTSSHPFNPLFKKGDNNPSTNGWYDTFPSCDPSRKEFFGCPCTPFAELKARGGPYAYLDQAPWNAGSIGPGSQACTDYLNDPQMTVTLRSDWKTGTAYNPPNSRFCKTYGPCQNMLKADPAATAPKGSHRERFLFMTNPLLNSDGTGVPLMTGRRNRKKLQTNTLYKCYWSKKGKANGGNTVGCQNLYAESFASGNHVNCDKPMTMCCLGDEANCKLARAQTAKFGRGRALICNPMCLTCRPCRKNPSTGKNEPNPALVGPNASPACLGVKWNRNDYRC